MENLDVLVRGVVMQNPGPGLELISFRRVELLWVAVVAMIVLALLSVKRVSIVRVGWTWGSKPGLVRVRVQSFSSMSDIGMFDDELLNCSADSCSEDASSSSSDDQSGTAEMVFIFGKKMMPLNLPSPSQASIVRIAPETVIGTRQTPSQDFEMSLDSPSALFPIPQPTDAKFAESPWREGIDPDFSQTSRGADSPLSLWAQSLTTPLVGVAPPPPATIVKNVDSSCEWDPLWKLRIRDAVVRDTRKYSPSGTFKTLPRAPVATQDDSIVTLKEDVVRLWNSEARCLVKSVHLPNCNSGDDLVTAFDADWESKVAVAGRKGGRLLLTKLEGPFYEKCYETNLNVQALHLDRSSSLKTIYTGGPTIANPGCSVSLWDSRSSSCQLSVNLNSASSIYGIRSLDQELYVRDQVDSLAAHDVRMLGAASVTRVASDVNYEHTQEDRWWDIGTTIEGDQDDEDDEFSDSLTANDETKGARGSSYMGSLVRAMSRNFSTKSPSP